MDHVAMFVTALPLIHWHTNGLSMAMWPNSNRLTPAYIVIIRITMADTQLSAMPSDNMTSLRDLRGTS